MSIDPSTVTSFGTLTRDQLRDMAREHNVRGRTQHGTPVPSSSANKAELVWGFNHARDIGRFRSTPAPSDSSTTAATNGNLTVKAQNVVLFLQGKGCHEAGTYYIGAESFKDGRVRLVNCLDEASEEVGDLDDYDNFWTTLSDLRDLVAALETYNND